MLRHLAGFAVPAWSPGASGSTVSMCLAPWRRAPDELALLLVSRVPVRADDVFVDLGAGDGRLANDVFHRLGLPGGWASRRRRVLVGIASADAARCGVSSRVRHLPELIGLRGLSGATVVFAWLVSGGVDDVVRLISEALAAGVSVRSARSGSLVELASLGRFVRIGEVRRSSRRRLIVEDRRKLAILGRGQIASRLQTKELANRPTFELPRLRTQTPPPPVPTMVPGAPVTPDRARLRPSPKP